MARNTRVISELGSAKPVTGYKQLATTSAAQLTNRQTPLTKGIHIKIATGVSGTLFVSSNPNITAGTNPNTSGYPVSAGEEVFFPAADLSNVWVRPSAAPLTFSFLYY